MSGWLAIAVSVVGSMLVAATIWGAMRATVAALTAQVKELAEDVKSLGKSVTKLGTHVAVLHDRDERERDRVPTGRHRAVSDSDTPDPVRVGV
jgi:outer membrane murein-binding lipoprotein Lpp